MIRIIKSDPITWKAIKRIYPELNYNQKSDYNILNYMGKSQHGFKIWAGRIKNGDSIFVTEYLEIRRVQNIIGLEE